MFKDSKIYVAGSSGMLGSALIRELQSEGYDNIIVRSHKELDLIDSSAVNDFFTTEKIDYLFLAAGLTGGIIANKTYPARFLYVNLAIQNNLFEAVQQFNLKGMIFYGSSCIYPKLSPQPIKEEYLFQGDIEITSEAYAVSKIAGLYACKAYNHQYRHKRFLTLIPNNMYGPNDNFDLDNSHVLAALICKIDHAKQDLEKGIQKPLVLWGSGTPKREFIFVDDVAKASIFAMKNRESMDKSYYNIGTGSDYSIRELAEKIAQLIGYREEILWDKTKPDGVPRKLLDSSNFLSHGWQPTIDLDKGIELTYQWFLKQDSLSIRN